MDEKLLLLLASISFMANLVLFITILVLYV